MNRHTSALSQQGGIERLSGLVGVIVAFSAWRLDSISQLKHV